MAVYEDRYKDNYYFVKDKCTAKEKFPYRTTNIHYGSYS